MKRKLLALKAVTALTIAGVVASCGSGGTSNEEGTSLLLEGFKSTAGGTGVSAYYVHTDGLGKGRLPAAATFRNLIGSEKYSTGKFGVPVVETPNNYIRMKSLECSYEVPGARGPLPELKDWIPANGIVFSADHQGNTASSTSSSSSSSSSTSTSTSSSTSSGSGADFIPSGSVDIGFPLIGYKMGETLRLNAGNLPEAPYQIIATCFGVGTSRAGDYYTSNPLSIAIEVTDVELPVATTTASDEAAVTQ